MAYSDPGAVHADDWNATITGNVVESKVSHLNAPLTTNPLTNARYTNIARRFLLGSGFSEYLFVLNATNPSFVNASEAAAASCAMRSDNTPFTASFNTDVFVRYDGTRWYGAAMNWTLGRLMLTHGGSPVRGLDGIGTLNDWYGLRVTAATEGLDVRIRVFSAGRAALNAEAGGNGEPVWVERLSCRHQNGTSAPQDIVGGFSLGNFATSTPILSGNFGLRGSVAGSNTGVVYLDAPRFKRMP